MLQLTSNIDNIKLLDVITIGNKPCVVRKTARLGGKILCVTAIDNDGKLYRITNKLAYN